MIDQGGKQRGSSDNGTDLHLLARLGFRFHELEETVDILAWHWRCLAGISLVNGRIAGYQRRSYGCRPSLSLTPSYLQDICMS